jgi:4-hydroxy-3-methylbut-2-enyl diphosphate reductase
VSPGFDAARHLQRIGVANQTTMLARESLAIAEAIGASIERGRGEEARATSFRSFDTICSATQERQDAVRELLDTGVDVMIVIGGFNSSNTISLAALCSEVVPTYHIETSAGIDPGAKTIHYRRAAIKHSEADAVDWLPSGPVRVGITAGASTPNNKIGDVVVRILGMRGERLEI